MTSIEMPEPSAEAIRHSQSLAQYIRQAIQASAGAISFSRFMELALYAPGLGYYSAGARKFGSDGDFITAPELGPVFAQCMAQSVVPVLHECGHAAQFLELGGGSGAFAVAAMTQFAQMGIIPNQYLILEPSADLRQRQQQLIKQQLSKQLANRFEWLDRPPEKSWRGVLFANEVLDALPTSRFAKLQGEVFEEFVVLSNSNEFIRVDQPADALLHAAVGNIERRLDAPMPDGYRSEVLPQLPYWIQAVGGLIQQGAMLFVDYGYPRREYYLPERRDGSLICHYRHRAHNDPFAFLGLQDITAFVDFTALVEAGTYAGFDFAGYCSQANYLICNGLSERIAAAELLANDVEIHTRKREIKKLSLPGEMGERFQVMGFTREVDMTPAFALGDLSHRL